MIRLPEETGNGSLLADLTPLLDVIFIVLVFLLLTANTPLLDIPVALPDSAATVEVASRGESERVTLVLHGDGHWQLAEESFAGWPELQAALKAQPNPQPLRSVYEAFVPSEMFLQAHVPFYDQHAVAGQTPWGADSLSFSFVDAAGTLFVQRLDDPPERVTRNAELEVVVSPDTVRLSSTVALIDSSQRALPAVFYLLKSSLGHLAIA